MLVGSVTPHLPPYPTEVSNANSCDALCAQGTCKAVTAGDAHQGLGKLWYSLITEHCVWYVWVDMEYYLVLSAEGQVQNK